MKIFAILSIYIFLKIFVNSRVKSVHITMSPEPTHEPIQENLTVSNALLDTRMMNDEDSDDEDIGMAGYVPLSQVSTDADPILDREEVILSSDKILIISNKDICKIN